MMSEITGVEKVLERLTLKRAIIDKSNLWVPMFNVSELNRFYQSIIFQRIETEAKQNKERSCCDLFFNNEPVEGMLKPHFLLFSYFQAT